MWKNFKIVSMVCLAGIATACSDLIEDSIEDKTVVVITPTDGTISTNFAQTFWWEELEGALNYRLQIVYNRFDSAAEFRLDTLISNSKTRFKITLKPAIYQWRVEAFNGSSKTKIMTVQNLKIDSASIVGQDILLTSPVNNTFTRNPEINFKWQSLPGAVEYRFLLYAKNNSILLDSLVRGVSELTYIMKKDSVYYWTVTGKRASVMSNSSEKWNFTLDRVAPDSVKLLSPAKGALATSPVTLSWGASADQGLAYYEIYVYKNNSSTPFSNKYNPYSTANDATPMKTSLVFNEGNVADRILWKVQTVDKAGNKSSGENIRSFTIQ